MTPELRFSFDVQGFLHLRGALSPDEVATYTTWMDEVDNTDIHALNSDDLQALEHQLNRPLSRVIDADPRFALFLDHPAVAPILSEVLGEDYRHIDNDLYFTSPGFAGGVWHRGVRTHPTGQVVDGAFSCSMVKVFFCMTDVGKNEGEFALIPGSHRAQFDFEMSSRIDLPAQWVFSDVRAGDIIIFNEAVIHNGRPNPSAKTRKTIIMNFGRVDAGAWPGYAPKTATLEAVTPGQRAILTNSVLVWSEPNPI